MTVAGLLRSAVAIVACAGLAVAVQGCQDPPAGPSTRAPFTQTDLRVGTGADAAPGNALTVNYTGWLYDGSKPDSKGVQFDTSEGREEAFIFTLGAGQVINGWDLGLVGMKAGGARRLVVPPSLGYGASRNGPIPPFATLVFDVELVSIQ